MSAKLEINCLLCNGVGSLELTENDISKHRGITPLIRTSMTIAMHAITTNTIRCLEKSNEGDLLMCPSCVRDVPVIISSDARNSYKLLRCECGAVYYVKVR